MKKTIKVVSILISVFMFMQTMAGAVLAAEEGSIECPCAAKVCYDLGIMPNVYEDADKFVTYDGFHRIVANLFGYSKPTVAPHDNITLGDVLSIICAKTFGSSSEEIIVISGMRNNIEIDDSANITYAQLAKVVYDTLLYRTITVGEGGFVIDERGNMGRENYKSVTGGLLYNKGYVKYVGDVTVSGDTAAVSGKLYDMENQHGTEVKDVALKLADKDLKGESDCILFVKDDTIVSAISAADADAEKITKNMTPPTVIKLTIGDVNATVDGKNVTNDVAPIVVNDRTMLPIRFVAEALGASVSWFERTKTVSIQSKDVDISLTIGGKSAEVTDRKSYRWKTETVELDSPSFIENGRTYLPLRFVAEKLGADVQWDGATQTITIIK